MKRLLGLRRKEIPACCKKYETWRHHSTWNDYNFTVSQVQMADISIPINRWQKRFRDANLLKVIWQTVAAAFLTQFLDHWERQGSIRHFFANLELWILRGGGWAHSIARQPKQGLPKHTLSLKSSFLAGKVYFEAGVMTNTCQLSPLVEAERIGNRSSRSPLATYWVQSLCYEKLSQGGQNKDILRRI